MTIDEMISALEEYLEDAGFEDVRVKYLNSKSDEEIRVLYEGALDGFGKSIKI